MEWKLGIESLELNQRLLHMEEQLTTVRDQMSILENRSEHLGEVWKGEAQVKWSRELRGQLFRLQGQVVVLQKQKLLLKKMAYSLIQLEQSIEDMVHTG